MRGGTAGAAPHLRWGIPFQSTRPVRGGTWHLRSYSACLPYFNPPAPCGAGHGLLTGKRAIRKNFNPPAPCGAGPAFRSFSSSSAEISIHPPRAGRDTWGISPAYRAFRFQSTRPVRGGTLVHHAVIVLGTISIHPPRAGRDHGLSHGHAGHTDFNPPAPCGAGRTLIRATRQANVFQSTRPVRGGTSLTERYNMTFAISIHPPRAGRDNMTAQTM